MENDITQRRFRWALVLAWAPWIAFLIGFWDLFIGMNHSKATGLAVVWANMFEMLVWWGLPTLVIVEVVALIWLLRSFSKQNVLRNLIALVSVCASGMMLLFVAGFLWIEHYITHLQTDLPR